MKRLSVILFFFFITTLLCAQSTTEIRAQKEKSEKEIAYLNKLLKETENSRSLSIDRLNMIQQKMTESKNLITILNQEMKMIERRIDRNEKKRQELIARKETLLDMYSRIVYGLWKKRDNTNKLMFIVASSDFNQAYKRYKYFEQIQSYSKRQLILLDQINDSIHNNSNELKSLMIQKNTTLKDINNKNIDLIAQQKNENKEIESIKKKEKEIAAKIKKEQQAQERLTKELEKLIAAQNKKSSNSTAIYKMTPEEKLVSDDFVKNKGKLPWPVSEGVVIDHMGMRKHPVHTRITIRTDGVNIATSKNSDVRSIFKGTVIEVLFIKGSNNAVVIRHGNYMTVYSNLMDVNVKVGQNINTKQVIGKVGFDEDKGSVFNFQIWTNSLERLNPEQWLAKQK
ncbi:MAG: peptidoglycan DD-metalloendopeptidase family protein [Culturomica sp.]|jgi:murein DD-endopeptidase MepM/ murein hydrolase activator NlpD|nr:peptidoglycan DD-metalloendopeptidase family protein [Culturomica sp.]